MFNVSTRDPYSIIKCSWYKILWLKANDKIMIFKGKVSTPSVSDMWKFPCFFAKECWRHDIMSVGAWVVGLLWPRVSFKVPPDLRHLLQPMVPDLASRLLYKLVISTRTSDGTLSLGKQFCSTKWNYRDKIYTLQMTVSLSNSGCAKRKCRQ